MSTYYIDTENGKDTNNGKSATTPAVSLDKIDVKPGDTVLFKRGTYIRGKLNNICGTEGKPITYGAYGEGKKPIFSGSLDVSCRSMWKEEKKNVWVCSEIADEAGNFVFDNGEKFGTLKWSQEELSEQGDFYDNCFGYSTAGKNIGANHKIYMYSKINPGEYYRRIECAVYGERSLADTGRDMIFEELKFVNSGVHAIAGEGKSRNITVRNCSFENIGGCVWDKENKIRFGNGVECWNVAENITVSNCVFNNIYDSAVTHQGDTECEPAKNLIIVNNVFIKCGMAAYEQRDVMPEYAEFTGNICIDAGEGFSKLGEIMPRRSEIWPQPMGHHIFLWRMDKPTEGGKLIISNNKFLNAPYGAAIYSIIDKAAEKQVHISDNIYYTENGELLNYFGEKSYRKFEEYAAAEKLSQYICFAGYKEIKEVCCHGQSV